MDNKVIVNQIHSKYAGMVGSEQIATKLALTIVADHLDHTSPTSILEIGSGIGTITELLAQKAPNSTIYGYEINDWCIAQLEKNLALSNIFVLKSYSDLKNIQNKIDFLILDDYLDQQTTYDLILSTRPETIFIEGHRRKQRLYVMQAYKNIGWGFTFKNFRKSSDSNKGGCVISHSPANSCREFFYFRLIKMTFMYSKVREIRSRIHLRKLFGQAR